MSAPSSYPLRSYQANRQIASDAPDESESTDTASEVESTSDDCDTKTTIKDQLYLEKLSDLCEQLQKLEDRTHPEYLKRFSEIKSDYQKRIDMNDIYLSLEKEKIDREYRAEIAASRLDYRVQKAALQETLINRLEETKRSIASELPDLYPRDHCVYLLGRKLRGHLIDSSHAGHDRSRPARPNGPCNSINYLLDDNEITKDLKRINPATGGVTSHNGRGNH